VIVVTGLPGVGKTELVNTLFLKVLTDWRPVWMKVAIGSSMSRLVAEIGAALGHVMDVDSLGTATETVFRQKLQKLFLSLFSTERNAMILDDLKDLRVSHRDYRQLQIFLEEATDIKPYVGSRVFIISSASVPPLWMRRAGIARIHIRGLDEKYVRRVLEYQLREARLIPGESAVDIPQTLLNAIDGHPLAAKIAAVASARKGLQGLADGIVLAELEASIVSLLLPEIELSPEEYQAARALSIFRQPVESALLSEYLDVNRVQALATRAIVEYDGRFYSMHAMVRKHYYATIEDSERKSLHKKAAAYYYKITPRDHLGHFSNLNSAFELVHHLALAGDFRELYDLRMWMFEEVYPAARLLYSQRQYDRALEMFCKLAEIRPRDPSVWAYIGRCYGRRGQWTDCDEAFKKAIEIAEEMRQPTSWLHRDWGHIRARFGFYQEAKPHLIEARTKTKGKDPGTLSCEAFVFWKTGDIPQARSMFESILKDHPSHTYSLSAYSKLFDELGDTERARELRAKLKAIRDEMIEPELFDFDVETDFEI
jgi:tetratricopeptide (TPR) repeat protein